MENDKDNRPLSMIAKAVVKLEKSVKFLDNKLNELNQQLRSQAANHEKLKGAFEEQSEVNKQAVSRLEQKGNLLGGQITELKNSCASSASTKMVSDLLAESESKAKTIESGLSNRLSGLESDAASLDRVYRQLSQKNESLAVDIKQLIQRSNAQEKNHNELSRESQDQKNHVASSLKQVDLKLSQMKDFADSVKKQQSNLFEKQDQQIAKLEGSISSQSKHCNDSLFNGLSELHLKLNEQRDVLNKLKDDSAKETSRLEAVFSNLKRNGNPVKKLEDFMNQVSFNAQQIARIQKKLDERHGG